MKLAVCPPTSSCRESFSCRIDLTASWLAPAVGPHLVATWIREVLPLPGRPEPPSRLGGGGLQRTAPEGGREGVDPPAQKRQGRGYGQQRDGGRHQSGQHPAGAHRVEEALREDEQRSHRRGDRE